ncbi:hypothetical protein IVB16_30275 [Bradyrhizobium sp. 183]|uniref:hypothetical protein n=1 Tax=unclassified Bradyrhizobium TaxID=2631580 RepID=UPI001FFF33B3|nr:MULTISPECIES: hypothetical protein [unclassified Bradyrhizobium]UPJ79093.1 hypothetical protein IVB17_30280 [Bradyrhizobium sp. 184]UPJ86886.1 hypothetical protein IVB16_30275 [Bradyrhizobium sp. 183]
MALSVRFYLFAEDGLKRISQRVMMALVHAQDAMPQYAGTKQKVADVILEVEDGKPLRIQQAEGTFLRFDERGQVREGLVASGLRLSIQVSHCKKLFENRLAKSSTSLQSSIERNGSARIAGRCPKRISI